MSKTTKKVIAMFLSVLLVLTSVPFVALADDATLDDLNAAIAAYETKMDGTVYKNMANAYTAYYDAIKARDAYTYGKRTDLDINASTTALQTATESMTAFTASFNTVSPSFHGDDLRAYSGSAYSNMLYSPQVDEANGSAENTNAKVKYELFYAPTVFAYDGVTQLRMPVMVDAKLTTEKTRYLYGCYPMAGADNYSDHSDLALVGYWYSGDNSSGHKDSQSDGNWSFAAQVESNLQTFGYNNDTGFGVNQSTDHRSQQIPNSGTLFWWASQYFFCANIMNVNTTFSAGQYLKTYQPYWYICASESPNSTYDATTMRGSNIIYVINFKALTDAIGSYTAALADVTKYNKDYSDMLALMNAYDAATSFNINSYNFQDSSKIVEAADRIKALCNGLGTANGNLDVSDTSDYSRLFKAIDAYSEIYSAGNTHGDYDAALWTDFTIKYERAVNAAGCIYEDGYAGSFDSKSIATIAENLDFMLNKSGDCGEGATFDYDSSTGVVNIVGTGDLVDYTEHGADSPFAGSTKITNVVIADGVTSIGDYTFSGCTSLESVTIPATVTRVGEGAFEDCSSLSTIVVPAGATYGDNAFTGCTSLESVEFSNGEIASKGEADHNAPWYQPSVKSIVITTGVTKIGQNAFSDADNIERLSVPCDIPVNTASNTNAFSGMTGLKYITITPGNTGTMINWGENNYYKRSPWYGNRENLEMHITVAPGVKNIADYAFYECANIDDISIPATVTSIGERAFYGCAALDDVYIYDANCEIYDSAFTFRELIKIHGYEYSTAQDYATKYNRDFILLGQHTHNYTSAVTKPTCTARGYTTHTCAGCGDTYIDTYTDALGHDYVGGSTVQPTCQHGGYTVYTCSRCGHSYNGDEKAPIAHNFVAGTVVAPTCQHVGYTIYTCTMCQTSEHRNETPLAAHDYAVSEIVEANCQHGGYTVYTCTVCSHSYQGNATPKTEHNYTIIEPHEPTCTAGGYTQLTCAECHNSIKTNETEPLGHVYSVNGAIARASFTTEGNVPVKCTRCLDTSNQRIECPTAELEKTAYTYTGKAISPAVILKNGAGEVIPADQYTVTYQSGRVKVGTYKVTVTFNKDCEYYYGTTEMSFKINPKGTALTKVTAGTQTITATWKKQATQTKGYQLQVSTDAKFKKGVKTVKVAKNSTVKATVKKLNYNTKYYVRIRTYQTVNKVDYFSAWSAAKTVTVQPVIKNASVSKLTAGKKQFTAKWKKVKGVTGYEVQYSLKSNMSKAKTAKVNGAKKTSVKVAKLKAKKKYFVRIRAVKKVGKKTYYGNWSKVKSVKVK